MHQKCKAPCVKITRKLRGTCKSVGLLDHVNFHVCRSGQFRKYVLATELHVAIYNAMSIEYIRCENYMFLYLCIDLHSTKNPWLHSVNQVRGFLGSAPSGTFTTGTVGSDSEFQDCASPTASASGLMGACFN